MRWAEDVEEHDDRAQRREVDMDNVRKSALDDESLENMESALKEALTAVSEGRLNVDDALGDILYLIHSIDNGEPSEIKTWTAPGALTKKITRIA
jgi:hypothetical protein